MKRNASNVNTLRNDNLALILNEIRKAPVSRAQLAGTTGLTKSAVTMIVNELITQGLLVETEAVSSAKGRRPILLDIVPDYRFAAGVELHRKQLSVVITDLKSRVIGSISRPTQTFCARGEAIEWICDQIRRLMLECGVPSEKLAGIGVSSPGPLDYREGVILQPPNFQLFADTPIAALLKERFNCPVLLENNSVVLAMREYFAGGMKKYRNSLFVIISEGIGSCMITDGQIYRGLSGFAGELGHISIDKKGPRCSCGNRGCTELYATKAAILKRHAVSDYKKLVEEAYRGDEKALSVLQDAAECLAEAFISAVNLMDLDSIFIYGELNYRPQLLISRIFELVNSRCVISRAHPVGVFASAFTADSAAAASPAAVLAAFFDQRL